MRRASVVWIAFFLCLAIAAAAMGWVSVAVVRLDRAEADARQQAALEEKVRLALWRIDSTLAPLLARESVRPYFAYASFLPVDRAYSRMFNRGPGKETLTPSPLLAGDAPDVLVHFQFEPDGRLTSPQAPGGDNFRLAVPSHVTEAKVRKAEAELARLGRLVDRQRLLALLPPPPSGPPEVLVQSVVPNAGQRLAQRQRRSDLQQRGQSALEFDLRNEAVAQSVNVLAQNGQEQQLVAGIATRPSTDLSGVAMASLWIDGQLILARRITAGGSEYVQGCLLDWPAVKASLLETIEDLLPGADLAPAAVAPGREEARLLAALPVRLVPSSPAADDDGAMSPIVLSLAVTWACVVLAAAAVAVLLAGVLRLSQRRASFVSAVTHELRTPLTTFQMYAEMLAEGMVPDRQQQQQYLQTLRAEALRLTHMVENVLAYARLERGRTDGRMERLSLGDLLEPLAERLAGRAQQAGMELLVQADGAARQAAIRANRSAVEQILFNLADNACKYAAGAVDKRLHLDVRPVEGAVELRMRDHGPGISGTAQRRLFRSFSKSAHEAARSAPGIGLGLALSRRLARDMGGDLRLDRGAGDGACFVLTLPQDSG